MSTAIRAESSDYRGPGEREIANGVEHFMADEFIFESQTLAIEDAIIRKDDGVLERSAESQPLPPQAFGVARETKGARA
jgi:hypothetical protein